jgi:hypothetical protein
MFAISFLKNSNTKQIQISYYLNLLQVFIIYLC